MENEQKMDLAVQQVRFNGDMVNVLEDEGEHYVAMKPVCDALGLYWGNQFRVIQKDPVLNSVVVKITTTGFDGKSYEMICLPLEYLNGWLFKVDAARYEGDRQEKIIRYQKECYQVLHRHFFGHPARAYMTISELERKVASLELMISGLNPV